MVESFFETIVETTLAVSVVIALLLIFSKVLDKNYTAKWRYWVWLVLSVRLLIPFNISLPNAPIRLYESEMITSAYEINNQQNAHPIEQTEAIGEQMIKNTVNENFANGNSEDEIWANNNLVLPQNEAVHYQKSTTDSFNIVSILSVLSILWIVGTVLFLAYQLIVYFSYRRKIRSWCRHVTDQELLETYDRVLKKIKIYRNIPIMICKIIKSPMVLGFWNPVLLLPDTDFSKQHLKMILCHEVIHIKRRDILYKTLILLARAVHWFNPLVHIMSVEANKDVELSCDAAVVENQNVDYRKDYSEAILMSVYKGNRSKAVFSTYFGGGKKMLKRRFTSLFDLRKKRKGVISLIFVALLIGVMGLLISCNQNADIKIKESNKIMNKYESEALGFSLNLPEEWKNKYIVEESEASIEVFSKKVYEEYNKGTGLLFTIVRTVGELITEQDMQQAPQRQQILLQGNGYTYYIRWPSDVQYPVDNEEVSSEYKSMSQQIENVADWISLLGDQRPKASNEGFKVVGSSFFTVEIPENWDIKAIELSQPIWYMYDGYSNVGTIEVIPYNFSKSEEAYTADESLIQEFLYDDEAFREALISINSKYADQSIMDKVKNSFSFGHGPFSIIDLQTNAAQYIAGGGKKVFGRIEGFEMENGEPVAVRINTMKFIPDGIGDNNPNGYSIEDLNKVETYPIDMGAKVAPIVPPNNNTYGLYEMPLLDSNFLKEYDDIKYFYYNFIIGSDGQLKIVLAHYVP